MLNPVQMAALADAFKRKAVAHLVVDVQDLYCDPSHPYAREYDYSEHHKVADLIAGFVDACRPALAPHWIAHKANYYEERNQHQALNERAFCEAVLYRQQPREGDAFSAKPLGDAFECASLRQSLTAQKTETVLLSGVTLASCVKMTAAGAARHGLQVIVIEDLVRQNSDSWYQMELFMDSQRGWSRIKSKRALELLKA